MILHSDLNVLQSIEKCAGILKEEVGMIDSLILNIVEFIIPGRTAVSPKLEYNQPLYNMIPYLTDIELKELQ